MGLCRLRVQLERLLQCGKTRGGIPRLEVRETEVERLIDTLDEVRDEVRLGEISRLPRTMTSAYLSAHNSQLQSLDCEKGLWPPGLLQI